jgi:hypothetical protein
MLILQPGSELSRIKIPALPMLANTEFCFAMQKIKASPCHPREQTSVNHENGKTISRVRISCRMK